MMCYTFEGKSLYNIQKNIQNLLNEGETVENITMSTTKAGYETYYSVILIVK